MVACQVSSVCTNWSVSDPAHKLDALLRSSCVSGEHGHHLFMWEKNKYGDDMKTEYCFQTQLRDNSVSSKVITASTANLLLWVTALVT